MDVEETKFSSCFPSKSIPVASHFKDLLNFIFKVNKWFDSLSILHTISLLFKTMIFNNREIVMYEKL
jgi:hypothetical protein